MKGSLSLSNLKGFHMFPSLPEVTLKCLVSLCSMHFLRLSAEFEEVGGSIATVGLLVSAVTLL